MRARCPVDSRAGPVVTDARAAEPDGHRVHPALLVVDDDPAVRDMLVDLLRDELGGEVLAAADGDEALESMRAHPGLAAVVLDMVMRRVDGPTMLRRMRGEPALRPIPVVAGSASAPQPADLALLEGRGTFVAKPFDLAALLAAVRGAMRESRR